MPCLLPPKPCVRWYNFFDKQSTAIAMPKPTVHSHALNLSHAVEKQTTIHALPAKADSVRLLHTSDWHIGKRLHNEARYEDFAEFLAWLLQVLQQASIDVLIVAGDIFDTMTPSNQAQALYYHFLGQAMKCCRHIIITAGNHDSPSFLDAPKTLFRHFATHIVGTPSDEVADEVVVLHGDDGEPELIVACVPYLRDKDVRHSDFGESLSDKQKNTTQGIAKHYADIGAVCRQYQADIATQYHKTVPIIATGHLFAAGSSVAADDDGMRDLYVGSLGVVGGASFGDVFDYVALGHIHKAQAVAGQVPIYYSGSPMALGFGECRQDKYVLLVDLSADKALRINQLLVPNFRHLYQVRGDVSQIEQQLSQLIAKHQHESKAVWLDIEYTGVPLPSLAEHIAHQLADTPLVALNIKNKATQARLNQDNATPSLQSLQPQAIFEKLLEQDAWSDSQKHALQHAHDTLLQQLYENDSHAL